MSFDNTFKIWLSRHPSKPGHLGYKGATLKDGPEAFKTVALSQWGNTDTGEIRNQSLRFSTYNSLGPGNGYDFENPKTQWYCENGEIERLIAFLHSEVSEAGRYRIIDAEDPASAIIEALQGDNIDLTKITTALSQGGALGELLPLLLSDRVAQILVEQAAIQRRRELVQSLQELAAQPGTTETQMQEAMGVAYWLFGGRYTGVMKRNTMPMDQHDFLLSNADGSVHVIELKGPCIPALVKKWRSHWIVGTDVHEAVSQAMNYLRGLDELGAAMATTYRNEHGIDYDMRRNFATVVIGHPDHVSDNSADEKVVSQTIRSYNAHLSRVEVVTYKSLFDAAERMLAFAETSLDPADTDDPSKAQNAGF